MAETTRLYTAEHQETQYISRTDTADTHLQRGRAKREWRARTVRPLPTTAAPRVRGGRGRLLSELSEEPRDRTQAVPGAAQLRPELDWPAQGQGPGCGGVQTA